LHRPPFSGRCPCCRGVGEFVCAPAGRRSGSDELDQQLDSQSPGAPRVIPASFSNHLHPHDAGYRAMGEAIDLKVFE
jgi:lysophospholipase L1-like esterase